MSVDLNKNKAQILDAWKKVTENEDGYDWAIFGYEGRSLTLKVVSFTKSPKKNKKKTSNFLVFRTVSGPEASKR
jgi:hypothetical protein